MGNIVAVCDFHKVHVLVLRIILQQILDPARFLDPLALRGSIRGSAQDGKLALEVHELSHFVEKALAQRGEVHRKNGGVAVLFVTRDIRVVGDHVDSLLADIVKHLVERVNRIGLNAKGVDASLHLLLNNRDCDVGSGLAGPMYVTSHPNSLEAFWKPRLIRSKYGLPVF